MNEKENLKTKPKSLKSCVYKCFERDRTNLLIHPYERIKNIEEKENDQFYLIDTLSNHYGLPYDKDGFISDMNNNNIPVEYWSLAFLCMSIPSIVKLEKDKELLESVVDKDSENPKEMQGKEKDLEERIKNLEGWVDGFIKHAQMCLSD